VVQTLDYQLFTDFFSELWEIVKRLVESAILFVIYLLNEGFKRKKEEKKGLLEFL